ncbi:hypothetical protein, partial [Paraburkholderia sp. BL21I4N1]|uniref:hypothetical protein n=1 Tax=Paraburkholderia sp. BL21I4N1 TaxID=1938801 RepID=UPI000D443ABE
KPGISERELGLAFHERTAREGGYPVLGCIGSRHARASRPLYPPEAKSFAQFYAAFLSLAFPHRLRGYLPHSPMLRIKKST